MLVLLLLKALGLEDASTVDGYNTRVPVVRFRLKYGSLCKVLNFGKSSLAKVPYACYFGMQVGGD